MNDVIVNWSVRRSHIAAEICPLVARICDRFAKQAFWERLPRLSKEADERIGLGQFICDPEKPYWGFASWNHFFTRQFRPGVRPVAAPDDDRIIVSPCEATPYHVQRDVQLRDAFWVKSQPCSLQEIFTARHRTLAEAFVGGTIYQAFLSAFNYHRWRAPVSGTVTCAYPVRGTYYSVADSEGEDSAGLNDSQGYITSVAARAVIVIDCDDPAIGKVACIFVGMADVSSCAIDALPGHRVSKGDELGFFHYGGSTCCVIFQPQVRAEFLPDPPSEKSGAVKVDAHIATAR